MRFTKVVAILVVLIIVSTPITLSAQMVAPEDVCKQARIDAKKDVNGCLWSSVGFLGGILGWDFAIYKESTIGFYGSGCLGCPILPLAIAPSPPSARLIGMPPDYIEHYTKCYQDEERNIQVSNALEGCITSTFMVTVYFFTQHLASL